MTCDKRQICSVHSPMWQVTEQSVKIPHYAVVSQMESNLIFVHTCIWRLWNWVRHCCCSKRNGLNASEAFVCMAVCLGKNSAYIYIFSVELFFMRLSSVNTLQNLIWGRGNIFVSAETLDLCAETYWLAQKFINSARKLITVHANLFSCAELNLTPRKI